MSAHTDSVSGPVTCLRIDNYSQEHFEEGLATRMEIEKAIDAVAKELGQYPGKSTLASVGSHRTTVVLSEEFESLEVLRERVQAELKSPAVGAALTKAKESGISCDFQRGIYQTVASRSCPSSSSKKEAHYCVVQIRSVEEDPTVQTCNALWNRFQADGTLLKLIKPTSPSLAPSLVWTLVFNSEEELEKNLPELQAHSDWTVGIFAPVGA